MRIKYFTANIAAIVCVYSFVNCSVYSQAEYTDLVREYVKINENAQKIKVAKIKSVAEIFISGTINDTLRAAEYDVNGNLTGELTKRDTSAEKNGAFLIKRYGYMYKDGLLIERVDMSGAVPKKHYITYDDVGNISNEVVKEQGKVILETDYEYDNLSRLIESSSKDVVNSCKINESYSYDSYNNLAKKSTKNECLGSKTKPVNTIFTYKYDSKNRILEKQSTYPNAGYKMLTYKYGKNGEVTEFYESEGTDSYENTIYVYDDKTSTINVEKNEVIGELTKKITGVIQNDKFGNIVEEKYYDSNGKLLYTKKNIYEYY
jgi:hypothetical protein